MEVDSMLINHFKNNHLISRQLFNFNLCFNISDLLSEYLTSFMYGNLIGVKVKAMIDGKELEMRDFYSNYDYIPKTDTTIYTVTEVAEDNIPTYKHNVLDYLKDDQYIEFINKNKYVQNTIHWSLLENNDYIFNVYNGFGGFMNVDGETYYYSHNYGKSPELLNASYNIQSNNIGWCSNYKIETQGDWNDIINMSDDRNYIKLKEKSTDFKKNWVNDIRYNEDDSYVGIASDWDHFYCAIFIYTDDMKSSIISSIGSGIFVDCIDMGDGVYYARLKNDGDFIAFIAPESGLDTLTFAGIKN